MKHYLVWDQSLASERLDSLPGEMQQETGISDSSVGTSLSLDGSAGALRTDVHLTELSSFEPLIGPLALAAPTMPDMLAMPMPGLSPVAPRSAGLKPVAPSDTYSLVAPPPAPGLSVAASASGLTQAQVDAFETGLDTTLSSIASSLVSQVYAEQLSIVGDNLLAAANGEAAQLQFVSTLKGKIVEGLGTLNGAESYTEMQVETAINSKLDALGFSVARADLDLCNAADVKLSFVSRHAFSPLTVPVEGNLGLPHLGVATGGNARTDASFNFDYAAGGTDFYLNAGATQPHLTLSTDTTLPGFSAPAEFAFLDYTATNNAATPTRFVGNFDVALKDPDGDGRLRVGEAGDMLDATLGGTANINLRLASNAGSAALPQVGTDLGVQWRFAPGSVIRRIPTKVSAPSRSSRSATTPSGSTRFSTASAGRRSIRSTMSRGRCSRSSTCSRPRFRCSGRSASRSAAASG